MNARIKELIRDANTHITPSDRHAMLDLLENIEAENKKLAHERAVYRAVLEGLEFRGLDKLPARDNAVETAHGYGVIMANISKGMLSALEDIVTLDTLDKLEKFAKLATQGNA